MNTFRICIPYHSGLPYLKEAVRTVLGQTDPDWMLTVCDDSDHQADVRKCVEEFSDQRIRYLRNPTPSGIAGNWNLCLDVAARDPQSQWMTIFHGDDRLRSDFVSENKKLQSQFPDAAAIFCGASTIDENGRTIISLTDSLKKYVMPRYQNHLILEGERGVSALLRGNFIFCPTLSYNMNRVRVERFNPEYKMVIDLDMTLRFLKAGLRIVGVPQKKLYEYRRHGSNASAHYTQDLSRFEEELGFYQKLSNELRQLGMLRAARVADRAAMIWLYLLYSIARDASRGRLGASARRLGFVARHAFSAKKV